MVDESTDISNKEQAVICIRTVDDIFEVKEDFMGLYELESTTSDFIFESLKDALLCLNLPISKIRGQSYDGAANMSGSKNGVVKKIQQIENKAIYIHCNGHILNLATGDSVKKTKILADSLDIAYEISKLIKFSPKREAKLEKLKEELGETSTSIITFSSTRWTVKAKSIKSILDNYTLLIETFELDVKESKSMPLEMKSRIKGIIYRMEKFQTYFGLKLAYHILRHTDNLATKLQKRDLNAVQGNYDIFVILADISEEYFF